MLSPQELELLTAHLDGELSASQLRQVASLLERSGEAREMLQLLQEDSARLRRLPVRTVPVDLVSSVMDALHRSDHVVIRKPIHLGMRTTSHRYWSRFAVAAGVLFAVGVGSFWIHSLSDRQGTPHVDNQLTSTKGSHSSVGDQDERLAKGSVDPVKNSTVPDKQRTSPQDSNSLAKSASKDSAPPNTGAVLAANSGRNSPKLEKIELDLPSITELQKLSEPATRQAVRQRLSQLKRARVELTAKEAASAFHRLHSAMKTKQIHLHVDPVTKARLDKPQVKTDLVIFIENLEAELLFDLLSSVALADKQGEPSFTGSLVVKELTRWDRTQLTDLLGLDPTVNRPTRRRKIDVDVRKDLKEQTEQDVIAALEGRGIPRPGTEVKHHAYVSHLPSPKSRTPELKRFLELRRPAEKDTLQLLLLVLRHVGG